MKRLALRCGSSIPAIGVFVAGLMPNIELALTEALRQRKTAVTISVAGDEHSHQNELQVGHALASVFADEAQRKQEVSQPRWM